MASITIRNLDPAVKEALRVKAAREGHSMEEEVRLQLAIAVQSNFLSVSLSSARSQAAQQASAPVAQSLSGKTVLLVIGGSIAAYKALDLIRRLRERGARVRVVMTQAACAFITPLVAGALAGGHVFTELFSREDEHDVGHIRLAREADMVLVAPCTADRLAKMAAGQGNDLAGAVLLATRGPVLVAPAMNPAMWAHPATQANGQVLAARGVRFIGPEGGEMAESDETGEGRMSEPLAIVAAVEALLVMPAQHVLAGKHIIVTAGPTHEALDPVRYFANRSSGRQGYAIAAALARLGAQVTLISGPVTLAPPAGVNTVHVESACDMRDAVLAALPAAAAVFVAAVADWRAETRAVNKIKKQAGQESITLSMVETPDILAGIGHSKQRPQLVVGFAAETAELEKHAKAKLARKGADWIVANDVSIQPDGSGVMGGANNRVTLLSRDRVEHWPRMSKEQVAERLSQRIADYLHGK
ncbi:MAG: Bifunctional phosphopantothenoylcysteine decarboxylase/phosphopantothenate synthase [Candidatus Tokpelaia hoelldobleri]|uniref:Coenzyme A biosynthesis bifunctional protein CoaBC n=1 Tax=Candidatus Tokpelaia hoelldobleri TaxID=1902579 RepID=A0A1U9JSJ6_9HYPH|nr:MAG: Bifunctional phosphopantothenoylcysteine decarboxylase/phosphopantothenate synthase [Candidatus Tokpelaia hoelldoblerii]